MKEVHAGYFGLLEKNVSKQTGFCFRSWEAIMTEEERNTFCSALADSEYILVGIGGEWKKEKQSEI